MRLRRCANECLVFRESYDNGIQTHSSAFIGVTFFMSGRWLSVVMLWILTITAFSSFYLHYILIVNVTREEYCWNNASLTLNNEWINFKLGVAIYRTRHHPFNSFLVRRTSFVECFFNHWKRDKALPMCPFMFFLSRCPTWSRSIVLEYSI